MSNLSPKGQLVFGVHLFEKFAKNEKDTPKYGVCLMFDADAQKTDEYKAMQAAVKKAASEKFGDKLPKGFNSPFRDCVDNDYGFPEDAILVNFTSKAKRAPGVVDKKLNYVEDDGTIYSGGYGRVEYTIYAYDNESKGVGIGLSNFMWLAGGEPYETRRDPKAAFAGYAEDDVPADGGGDVDDALGF